MHETSFKYYTAYQNVVTTTERILENCLRTEEEKRTKLNLQWHVVKLVARIEVSVQKFLL